jgi:competence ComEA-like helix-hairpin-helix protein
MTPYTRHQLLILLVLLLVAGLGLAVGHWRRAHPDLVERLEQLDRRAAPPAPPPAPRGADGDARAPAPRRRGPAAAATDGLPIDLNHADAQELVRLPGVGPALAARIVAAREAAGSFATLDELRHVRGLGRAKLERLRPLVSLAP